MNFSKLRHRVIFLCPTDNITNSMGELVPRYKPFKPYTPLSLQVEDNRVYLCSDNDGNARLKYIDGRPYAYRLALKEYSVAAFVSPMSGREYEESQKIRAETTYKILTRYFPSIQPGHRILHYHREFDIISVLDIDGCHEQLEIIAAERSRKDSQTFNEDKY